VNYYGFRVMRPIQLVELSYSRIDRDITIEAYISVDFDLTNFYLDWLSAKIYSYLKLASIKKRGINSN